MSMHVYMHELFMQVVVLTATSAICQVIDAPSEVQPGRLCSSVL